MARACTRALHPGTPRPAGHPRAQTLGHRAPPAVPRWPGSPVPRTRSRTPVSAPLGRSGRSPSSPSPAPAPKPRGGGWSGVSTRVPRAAEPPRSPLPPRGFRRRLGQGRPLGVAGRTPARPPRPRGTPLTFGPELAGAPRPSCPGGNPAWRQKSCWRRTRRSEGGRGAAAVRASERPRPARRAGTGARGLPAAAARAGTCHILPLPRSANPLRKPEPRPRAAERQVRGAEAELRARAPPLNPWGPARGRDLPQAGGWGCWAHRL